VTARATCPDAPENAGQIREARALARLSSALICVPSLLPSRYETRKTPLGMSPIYFNDPLSIVKECAGN
jgi:hypothetical protein